MNTNLLPLIPGVHLGLPSSFGGGEASDEIFRAVRPSVLERDDNTCRFCGFRDKGPYMQIHHRDGDHSNNGMPNLVAACIHCHSVHHIGLWGNLKAMSVAWLPEITQVQVSALGRALLIARYGSYLSVGRDGMGTEERRQAFAEAGAMAEGGKAIEELLLQRIALAETILGTSDPLVVANALLAMTPEQYAERGAFLEGFRFVIDIEIPASPGQAPYGGTMAERWLARGGAFAGIKPEDWARMGLAA